MKTNRAVLRSALNDLELRARRIVEGLRAGGHASPRAGGTVEFDRHRAYQPGDDLRHLDWKVYARSDRLVLKRARLESTLDVFFLLDVSGSMAFESGGAWGSKHTLASSVVQALSWLAIDSGDRVAVMRCAGDTPDPVSLQGGSSGLQRAIERTSIDVQHGQRFDAEQAAATLTTAVNRPGLVVLVSDLLETPKDVQDCLGHLRFHGHDVLVLQVLDQAEQHFNVPDEVRLVDLEGSMQQRVHARVLRDDYLSALATHQRAVKQACRHLHVDHVLLDPHESPVPALQALLHRRGGSTATVRGDG